MAGFVTGIDNFFHITERGSNFKTEIKGGIITFLAMFYILAVNPLILQTAAGEEFFGQLVASTGLAACISCFLMGLYARFPVALAPGMGINAFVAFTIVGAMGFTYYQALMIVLISGVAFFVLTVTGIRKKIISSIPLVMKLSITAGIGFFIVVVGLFNCGIIEHADGSALMLGDLSAPGVLLSLLCIFITLILYYRNQWGALLASVVITVVIGFLGGYFLGWDTTVAGTSLIPGVGTAAVTGVVSMPDFGLVGALFSNFGSINLLLWPAFVVSIASLLIVDMFDTTGTLIAIGQAVGVSDGSKEIEGVEKALQADSVSTVIGAVAGVSTTTSFIESTTGIGVGARTGLMAVVVGIMFLITMFFAPVFSVITSACTVGALFLVGLMMVTALKDIDWSVPVNVATVFVTMFMMGLSGSITDGIALGCFTYITGMFVTRKTKEVSTMIWVLGIVFFVYYIVRYSVIPLI